MAGGSVRIGDTTRRPTAKTTVGPFEGGLWRAADRDMTGHRERSRLRGDAPLLMTGLVPESDTDWPSRAETTTTEYSAMLTAFLVSTAAGFLIATIANTLAR